MGKGRTVKTIVKKKQESKEKETADRKVVGSMQDLTERNVIKWR